MQWSTDAMRTLLTDSRWDIETTEPGGDVDTEALILRAHGAGDTEFLEGESDARVFLSVYGFKVEGDVMNPKDSDIDHTVLSDCESDDRGGLATSDARTCSMYAEVMARLRAAGFDVVPSLDPYF